jgi:hypothetical protein
MQTAHLVPVPVHAIPLQRVVPFVVVVVVDALHVHDQGGTLVRVNYGGFYTPWCGRWL